MICFLLLYRVLPHIIHYNIYDDIIIFYSMIVQAINVYYMIISLFYDLFIII